MKSWKFKNHWGKFKNRKLSKIRFKNSVQKSKIHNSKSSPGRSDHSHYATSAIEVVSTKCCRVARNNVYSKTIFSKLLNYNLWVEERESYHGDCRGGTAWKWANHASFYTLTPFCLCQNGFKTCQSLWLYKQNKVGLSY